MKTSIKDIFDIPLLTLEKDLLIKKIIEIRGTDGNSGFNEMNEQWINEQLYSTTQIYWHISSANFNVFTNTLTHTTIPINGVPKNYVTGNPTFLTRRWEFFMENRSSYNITDPAWNGGFVYGVKFKRKLNLFNSKNLREMSDVTLRVNHYINNFPDKIISKAIRTTWDAFTDSGYWQFAEFNASQNFLGNNVIMYDLIMQKLHYDGFVEGTAYNNGLMAIFDATNLEIVKKIPVDEFAVYMNHNLKDSLLTKYNIPKLNDAERKSLADKENEITDTILKKPSISLRDFLQ
jgi:hypothetical protein